MYVLKESRLKLIIVRLAKGMNVREKILITIPYTYIYNFLCGPMIRIGLITVQLLFNST